MTPLPKISVSPLSLNQLTRDLWGSFDAAVIARLAPLADDPCYTWKFYKAPGDEEESIVATGHANYGLKITPGSILFGFYLPATPTLANPAASVPPRFTVQITDTNLEHKLFDAPLSSVFLANYNPELQSNFAVQAGSFPNLLTSPYPVVGDGVFMVEIQEASGTQQRVQLVFGVLEVCG